MMTLTPEAMFSEIDRLPVERQAQCVSLAARTSLYIWQEFEQSTYSSSVGGELLAIFDEWLLDLRRFVELKKCADRLFAMLPVNLNDLDDPSAGFAGWAIYDVAMIALGECAEVLHSIVRTAVIYSAAAVCRSGHSAISVDLASLSIDEQEYLMNWWHKCRKQLLG